MSAETRPSITDGVWVCMACHHWQIDVLRRAVSDDPDIWHALAVLGLMPWPRWWVTR
mgnify:CR=1 FL=1